MRELGVSLAVALLAASCASSKSASAEPEEPFTFGNVLTEWVSEQEVHDVLEGLADEYGGEVADEYHAAVEPLVETEQLVYFFNPFEGSDPDPDVDVDADMLRMEVRTGPDLGRELSEPFIDPSLLPVWNESDRLPEGAEFRPLPYFGYAFRGAGSDEYVDVYVWRDWIRPDGESGEYEAVHLTAGAMVLRELNWAD